MLLHLILKTNHKASRWEWSLRRMKCCVLCFPRVFLDTIKPLLWLFLWGKIWNKLFYYSSSNIRWLCNPSRRLHVTNVVKCLFNFELKIFTDFILTDGNKSRRFTFDWNFIAARGAIFLFLLVNPWIRFVQIAALIDFSNFRRYRGTCFVPCLALL